MSTPNQPSSESVTSKASDLSKEPPPPSKYGVIELYNRTPHTEKDRLFCNAEGQVEFARTCSILERYLPKSGLVLDIGGGPGSYSKWLLRREYAVKLLDIVPRHVEEAKKMFAEIGAAAPQAEAEVGSAVSLPFSDSSADAVLLMGPMYHLTERDDRQKALEEAFRVMKPGTRLFVAGITRFASLLDGLDRGFLWDPVFEEIVRRDLHCGQHRNPTENPEYFTDAVLLRPNELADEVRSAGFRDVRVIGVEGPLLFDRNLSQNWQDEKRRSLLLDLARQVEEEPTLTGMSPHLLVVASKP